MSSKVTPAPFPLDRLKLGADGKWARVGRKTISISGDGNWHIAHNGTDKPLVLNLPPAKYFTPSGAPSVPPGAQLTFDDWTGYWNVEGNPTDTSGPPINCNHEWVDVGFSFSKFVCKHCNAEKPSDD